LFFSAMTSAARRRSSDIAFSCCSLLSLSRIRRRVVLNSF
jgi:hypothetical protein